MELPHRQPPKEPPSTMPKPNLGRPSTTTMMKLRVNFPDIEEGVQTAPGPPIMPNGSGSEEGRRGSLLLEGVMKAMQKGPATFEAEEDECYPEGATPWFLDSDRRDSIEHTRSKLAHKGLGGGGKGKLQRDRKKLREHKLQRAGGDSAFDETKPADDVDYEKEVEQETKKNTEYNEYLHPLMRTVANAEQLLAEHYPDLLRRSSQSSTLLPYPSQQITSSTSQYSYSTMSDETSDSSSLDQNPMSTGPSAPSPSTSTTAAHTVLEELDRELSALVEGLGDLSF